MEVSQTMLNVGACVLAGVIAYLLGSISFAIIVSRIYAHDDVRKYGSKNAGMTNILRTYGKMPAFFTLLGDFLKGVLAVVIGRWIFSIFGVTEFDAGYLAGFFALLGHLYPIYFGFKGGKGVLTSLGIILVVNYLGVLWEDMITTAGVGRTTKKDSWKSMDLILEKSLVCFIFMKEESQKRSGWLKNTKRKSCL